MAEPGKTLDLDTLLGPRGVAPLVEDWRTKAGRLFTEYGIHPRGVVHGGPCSPDDLSWYASVGFSQVLVITETTAPLPLAPDGLKVLRADSSVLRPGRFPVDEPGDYVFCNFCEGGFSPVDLPTTVQAVRWRFQIERNEALSSGIPAKGKNFIDQGLNLAFVGHLEASGHVDAVYLRRPVVTMSDFGRNGRFGNQLFQRTTLRLVALRQGAILQLPLWAGTALFETEEPLPSNRVLPMVKEETLDVAARELLCTKSKAGFAGMDYSGYGMSHTRLFTGHKELIRADHTFDSRMNARFDAVVGPRLAGGKKLVVIHLRRGDYGYGQFFRAPCTWYQEWMSQQGFAPASHVLFICSENPGRYRERFEGFTIVTADDLGAPAELAPYFDFLAMTQADALAIANSSFSFFAAMLNPKAGSFVRPDAQQGGLIPFDPWDAEPLLDQKLSPEEHRRLKEID